MRLDIRTARLVEELDAAVLKHPVVRSPGLSLTNHVSSHDLGVREKAEQDKLSEPAEEHGSLCLGLEPTLRCDVLTVTIVCQRQPDVHVREME